MSDDDFGTAFESLSPHLRTVALVGQFLQQWAAIELGMQNVIGEALEIKSISLSILSANIRFRDKANILRTLIDVSDHVFDADKKEHFKKVIRELAEYSATRNMIAHDPFLATEDGLGTEFITVKAKGNFARPEIIWKAREFREAVKKLRQFSDELDKLEDIFKDHPLTEKDVRSALAFLASLTPKFAERVNEHSQSRPTQGDPGSHPATEEKSAQTPDMPQR